MTGSEGGQSVIRVISCKVALNHKKQAGFKVRGRNLSSFSLFHRMAVSGEACNTVPTSSKLLCLRS